jgi:Domain of unknown function DUF1828.
MTIETIEQDFKEKVSSKIRLKLEGVERYRIFTPFMFDDGDHLAVVLKQDAGAWVLSDEGHTMMHLTYEMDEKQFQSGTRQKVITNALSTFSVSDRDGELIEKIKDNDYGNALFSFVQALMKLTDLTFLSRERVKSTFKDDFIALMSEAVPENRRTFDWFDQKHDPIGNYVVDCKINGMAKPLYVFALNGDDRTRDSTISIHSFEKWGFQFQSLAIFENQENINRKVLARLSDVCGKQFSNLEANKPRILAHVKELIR